MGGACLSPGRPQIMDTYKDDNAMSQLAAEVDSVSLEEPVPAVSPLGTTVLSPPSSPTSPPTMPVELPSSAPFWSCRVQLNHGHRIFTVPSTVTIENEEQDEERQHDEESEQDDEKDQDDIQMPSAAENVIEDFDLMGSTGGDHIKNAAPVSTLQERERAAVEKAEEEINEDNDEGRTRKRRRRRRRRKRKR